MLVLWVWIGVIVFTAVVLAFCTYELVWKSRRLQRDLERLTGLAGTLESLQTQVATVQQRLAAAQSAREAGS
jgi:uncharacterized protein YigA (DUF484 family)